MIQVDKGIPMPSDGRSKYPWKTMEVGDSFTVEKKLRASVTSNMTKHGSRRFTTRGEGELVRVWRVA